MRRIRNKSGFSLTEMLIATGIMALGLVMIATIFPVGIKLTSLTTERTIGAVVADEAFAKIQLYGMRDFQHWPAALQAVTNPPDPTLTYTTHDNYRSTTRHAGPDGLFWTNDDNLSSPGADGTWGNADDLYWDAELVYPSALLSTPEKQWYNWSAICRRVGQKEVQVTVFVSRKAATNMLFRSWEYSKASNSCTPSENNNWPGPVKIALTCDPASDLRKLTPDLSNSENAKWSALTGDPQRIYRFFDEGYTLVDDASGKVYKILEYRNNTIVLSQDWQWPGYPFNKPGSVQTVYMWVVPPAVNSDRYPCVGVYQKILYMDQIQ